MQWKGSKQLRRTGLASAAAAGIALVASGVSGFAALDERLEAAASRPSTAPVSRDERPTEPQSCPAQRRRGQPGDRRRL